MRSSCCIECTISSTSELRTSDTMAARMGVCGGGSGGCRAERPREKVIISTTSGHRKGDDNSRSFIFETTRSPSDMPGKSGAGGDAGGDSGAGAGAAGVSEAEGGSQMTLLGLLVVGTAPPSSGVTNSCVLAWEKGNRRTSTS